MKKKHKKKIAFYVSEIEHAGIRVSYGLKKLRSYVVFTFPDGCQLQIIGKRNRIMGVIIGFHRALKFKIQQCQKN